MPIDLDSYDESDVSVTPGTNRARVLRFVYANPGLGFTPREIADETAIRHRSIHTVLSRLQNQGLVGRTSDGYYHALDSDEAVRIARSLHPSSDGAGRHPEPTEGDEVSEGDRGSESVAEPHPEERRSERTHTHDPSTASSSRDSELADDSANKPDARSPVEPDGSEPPSPDEAFALLGNETRVAILRALWDAFESGTSDNDVPYSRLFEQAPIDDSGNFSYHLEKLIGPFIRQTDEGYELKQTGINVVRAVIAGTVIDNPAFGPTRIDVACPLCDAPVEVAYEDELLAASCTACEGTMRWNEDSGFLSLGLIPPAGIDQRPVEEAFRAAITYTFHEFAAFRDGVCPHCASPVEKSVDVCTNHAPGAGTWCPTCDRANMADVWMVCSTCKRSVFPAVRRVVLTHPTVTAFYHEHGIDHRFASWETVVRSAGIEEELVSEDPLRMRFTVSAGDDDLRLTLDDELNVLDVTQ